ncbi:MAG: hypothetical protein KJ077_24015 [Anaerolineae bacterium]|nr:hypothetical protein [Anaerolineae bacterium]
MAFALVHFAILAFTDLDLCSQETVGNHRDNFEHWLTLYFGAKNELTLYAGFYFALILANELWQIVLDHIEVWNTDQA